jgi:hypothetical protein
MARGAATIASVLSIPPHVSALVPTLTPTSAYASCAWGPQLKIVTRKVHLIISPAFSGNFTHLIVDVAFTVDVWVCRCSEEFYHLAFSSIQQAKTMVQSTKEETHVNTNIDALKTTMDAEVSILAG